MKTLSTLLILGCAQVLSADYYQGYQGQGNSGYYNSGYQDGQGYQGQGYYQGQGNQGQSQGYQRVEQSTPYQQAQQNPNDWSRNEQKQYSNPNQVNTSNWDNGVADEEINRKVKEALGAGWLTKGYPEVNSEVRMGIVTLRGTVDTIENKTKADEAVRKIAGVRGVNNQIAVDPNYLKNGEPKDTYSKDVKTTENKYAQDAAATAEDKVLNAKIREKLASGWFSKGFDAIILRTSNGVVLITGAVDSNDDVQKVHEQVKNVDGVREVNNQLTIKNK